MLSKEQRAKRFEYIDGWANTLLQTCARGGFGKPLPSLRIYTTQGMRTAMLDVNHGLRTGELLKAFTAQQSASLRQTIPWRFETGPFVYLSGPYVRIEVPWPDELQQDKIRLSQINGKPHTGGRWVAGVLRTGLTQVLQVNEDNAHVLFAGISGGGKSTALRGAVAQLASDPDNEIVLLDGKGGDGLGCVSGVPHLVGPMAVEPLDIKAALQWSINEMDSRYERKRQDPDYLKSCKRLVVAFDEIQELTAGNQPDLAVVEMMRRLAAQGRAAKIHLLLGTQQPNVEIFGDITTRRQLSTRCVFYMESQTASATALGSHTPDASTLTGRGDAYVKIPYGVRRVQFAWVDEGQLIAKYNCAPERFSEWPDFEAEDLGPVIEKFDMTQVAQAIRVAAEGGGRGALEQRTGLGNTTARRLLRYGKQGWTALQTEGFSFGCTPGVQSEAT